MNAGSWQVIERGRASGEPPATQLPLSLPVPRSLETGSAPASATTPGEPSTPQPLTSPPAQLAAAAAGGLTTHGTAAASDDLELDGGGSGTLAPADAVSALSIRGSPLAVGHAAEEISALADQTSALTASQPDALSAATSDASAASAAAAAVAPFTWIYNVLGSHSCAASYPGSDSSAASASGGATPLAPLSDERSAWGAASAAFEAAPVGLQHSSGGEVGVLLTDSVTETVTESFLLSESVAETVALAWHAVSSERTLHVPQVSPLLTALLLGLKLTYWRESAALEVSDTGHIASLYAGMK